MSYQQPPRPPPPQFGSNSGYSQPSSRAQLPLGQKPTEPPGCMSFIATFAGVFVAICFLPFIFCRIIRTVSEYERAVIFRLGRLKRGGAKGPGTIFTIPCIDKWFRVDLRTGSYDVPPQEILTRDSVTVTVDAVMYYSIFDPTLSVTCVQNSNEATRFLAATTLRNILGTKTLAEILSDKQVISNMMRIILDEATDPWGVKVERVEIKNVLLPSQLERAMAAEAEAAREARAKIIAAEGEVKASQALKEASDIMSSSSGALQLRYLQTLNTIAIENNNTVVFPLPVDIITAYLKK